MSDATVITYRDGTIVTEPADEHFARIEAEMEAAKVRHRHVANMLGLGQRNMRAEYLANLERREGAPAAESVRAAFLDAWTKRQAT